MDYTDRKKQIRQLRDEGKTYEEIGSVFGITNKRVRDIYLQSLRDEERAKKYKLMNLLPNRYFIQLWRAGVRSDEQLIEMIETGYDFSTIRMLGKNANHIIKFHYENYRKENADYEEKK